MAVSSNAHPGESTLSFLSAASAVERILNRHRAATPTSFEKGATIDDLAAIEAQDSIDGWKAAKHGGVLRIDSPGEIQPEAFEICQETRLSDQVDADNPTFTFRHNARRSIMHRFMGMDMGCEGSSHAMDIYTRAADSNMLLWFVLVGSKDTMYELPGAVKQMGLGAGIIGILAGGFVQRRIALRLLDVPQLIGKNLESYGDATKVCFWRPVHILSALTNILLWSVACGDAFLELLFHLPWWQRTVWPWAGTHRELIVVFLSLVLLMFYLVQRQKEQFNLKGLKRWGYVSAASAAGVLLLFFMFAVVRMSRHWTKMEYDYVPPDTRGIHGDTCEPEWTSAACRLDNIRRGCITIILAYSGLSIIPYIAAEMLDPQNAKPTVTRGFKLLTGTFVFVAVVGYLSFGKDMKENFLRSVWYENRHVKGLRPIHLLDVVAFLGSPGRFLIFLWALTRELDSFLSLQDLPAMQLNLSWALRRHQQTKMTTRIIVLFATTLGMYFMSLAIRKRPSKTVLMYINRPCIQFTQMVFMPLLCVIALRYYHQRYIRQENGENGENGAASCTASGSVAGFQLDASRRGQTLEDLRPPKPIEPISVTEIFKSATEFSIIVVIGLYLGITSASDLYYKVEGYVTDAKAKPFADTVHFWGFNCTSIGFYLPPCLCDTRR